MKIQYSGNILKMRSQLESPVQYQLPLGNDLVPLNPLLGKKIKLQFNGVINCIATGKKITKSYNQGYSFEAFRRLAQCDQCIMSPELCHYDKGTCREPEWGQKNCMIDHILYLAITSGPKVGITRHTQVPTRWIDQGAVKALPIIKIPTRYASGLLEVEIKAHLSDKTNWRKMLKGEIDDADLYYLRDELLEQIGEFMEELGGEDLDESQVEISYPLVDIPLKISALSFDKNPCVEGVLKGIKGQYLIFEQGVLNIRKHQGYKIDFSY